MHVYVASRCVLYNVISTNQFLLCWDWCRPGHTRPPPGYASACDSINKCKVQTFLLCSSWSERFQKHYDTGEVEPLVSWLLFESITLRFLGTSLKDTSTYRNLQDIDLCFRPNFYQNSWCTVVYMNATVSMIINGQKCERERGTKRYNEMKETRGDRTA